MKKELSTLARYRLKRSKSTFKDGLLLLKNKSLNGALNRFYYAAFYAARALLATQELDSSKHSGVIFLFHKHFVKTNVISIEIAKTLSQSFEKRQDSDYEDFFEVEENDVVLVQNKVEGFIKTCEIVLKKL